MSLHRFALLAQRGLHTSAALLARRSRMTRSQLKERIVSEAMKEAAQKINTQRQTLADQLREQMLAADLLNRGGLASDSLGGARVEHVNPEKVEMDRYLTGAARRRRQRDRASRRAASALTPAQLREEQLLDERDRLLRLAQEKALAAAATEEGEEEEEEGEEEEDKEDEEEAVEGEREEADDMRGTEPEQPHPVASARLQRLSTARRRRKQSNEFQSVGDSLTMKDNDDEEDAMAFISKALRELRDSSSDATPREPSGALRRNCAEDEEDDEPLDMSESEAAQLGAREGYWRDPLPSDSEDNRRAFEEEMLRRQKEEEDKIHAETAARRERKRRRGKYAHDASEPIDATAHPDTFEPYPLHKQRRYKAGKYPHLEMESSLPSDMAREKYNGKLVKAMGLEKRKSAPLYSTAEYRLRERRIPDFEFSREGTAESVAQLQGLQNDRATRVGAQVELELRKVLVEDNVMAKTFAPVLQTLVISRVKMSQNVASAKVYWMIDLSKDRHVRDYQRRHMGLSSTQLNARRTRELIERVSGLFQTHGKQIRYALQNRLSTKFAPTFRFEYDRATQKAKEVERTLDELTEHEQQRVMKRDMDRIMADLAQEQEAGDESEDKEAGAAEVPTRFFDHSYDPETVLGRK